jgi:hypothetical protein
MKTLFGEPFHWLDSNVFIQAKNGPYGFEIAPRFWLWLESAIKDQLVRSPIRVYNELAKGKDQLSRWATKMKPRGLFVTADRSVQQRLGEIAAFVQSRYEHPYAAKFLDGADPWVIAHAADDQGTVVTHESLVAANCKDAKIPNVCAQFAVNCIDPYTAFRKLGLKL